MRMQHANPPPPPPLRLPQLAGNAAKVLGYDSVSERCVALAVRGDEELDRLFAGHIRDGGVESVVLRGIVQAVTAGHTLPSVSEFDMCFAALLREAMPAAPAGSARVRYSVAVDPRDGLHYAMCHVASGSGDSDETEDDSDSERDQEECKIFPVPHLDACSALPAALRRAAARDALPAGARDILDAELSQAAADPRFAARERLRRIRREQRRTDACLDEKAFCDLVLEIQAGAASARELVWSGEALQALQDAAESGLLALCRVAAITASNVGGRAMLRPEDLVAVQQTWRVFA
jgi:hypothetical protein